MGVGAGIFSMTNVPAKTADSADIEKQESDLEEAYAQSARMDKLVARDFAFALSDGLDDEPLLKQPMHSGTKNS